MYPNDPPILGGAFDYHDREQLEAMYSWAGSSCALSEWLSGQGISVDPNTLNKWRRRFGIEIARAVYRHRSDALKAPTSDQDRHLIDLEKARLRVEHAETQLRILSKETARNELLADSLREAVRALPSITVSPPAYTKAQRMSPVTQVVHVSDWHYGEVVDSRQTGGANQYNAEIACRRLAQLERLILKARDIISHAHAVPRLRVFVLGDMASGSIHDLPETNELNVYEQWASGALVLSQFLQRLASQYKEVVVEGVPGNHGRMSERKRAKDRYVNWDYLIYQTIGLMLARQKNLTCRFPMDPFMLTEVEGFRYLLYHGDEIKSWMGIPWYGIDRAVARLRELFLAQHEIFEYVALAHFHQQAEMARALGKVLLNGSIVGGSEYSMGVLFVSSAPQQRVYFVHPEHGKTWELENDLSRGDLVPHPYVIDSNENLAASFAAVRR